MLLFHVLIHDPSSCFASAGIQRIVAFVACLIASSVSGVQSQWAKTNFPSSSAFLNSSYVFTSTVFSSLIVFVLLKRTCCISCNIVDVFDAISSPLILSFVPVSLRKSSTVLFVTSLGPTAIRTGTHLSSYSAYFRPGDFWSSRSILTCTARCISHRYFEPTSIEAFLSGHTIFSSM